VANIEKRNSVNTERLQTNLDNFLNSLSDTLIDISAIEVNTMVVDHISANKFIPWEAYRDIYLISSSYLHDIGIHPNLHNQYHSLRKKLELEYCVLLLTQQNQPDSKLEEYARFLNDPQAEVTEENTILPNPSYDDSPDSFNKIQNLLAQGRFLRCLRKLYELKSALDNQNLAIAKSQSPDTEFFEWEVTTDVIYAQSVIQLDGDIINRYDRKLLENKHKNAILEIHKQGVIAGEKQWHGLLQFVVNLVEAFVIRRGSGMR
jgi:hypothetical protein